MDYESEVIVISTNRTEQERIILPLLIYLKNTRNLVINTTRKIDFNYEQKKE